MMRKVPLIAASLALSVVFVLGFVAGSG